MTATQRVVQVDAFTARPFTGNPAAVCVLATTRDDAWMQGVALEMNLSETAFLLPEEDGFRLRWFTPTTEVELCGHATLASAHVLWEDGHLTADAEARFRTLSGTLTARRDGKWIRMDFPAEPPQEMEAPEGLAAALGAPLQWVGRNRFDLLVEVEDERTVRALEPDVRALRGLAVRGIIVTARAAGDADHDFVSRFFAPGAGVDEDPVTGSAHCALAPFWAERLGQPDLVGFQASARGGTVQVRAKGARVELGGQAVTMLRGELLA